MKRLDGRVAVITGASGGIGRATALRLADRGCSVALADIDADGLGSVAKELESRSVRVSTHRVDVASREAMQAFAREVEASHGMAHILVNNAGVAFVSEFQDQKLEDVEWLVGINYWGVVYGCHFFLPLLKRADEAHIVNLSSLFGFLGLPTQSAYCATKAAVRALSETLYAELRPLGIGVTSVHPGCIDTSIIRSGRLGSDDQKAEIQEFFDRFGAPPDVVASAILTAITKNKLRVRVRPESLIADWVKRLFPVAIHRLLARHHQRNATDSAKAL